MTRRRHTVRLASEVDNALSRLAGERGMTVYAMLPLCVEAGIAALSKPSSESEALKELLIEAGTLSAEVGGLGGMIDRALFTACAAYCYARSAAKRDGKTDETITAEIHRAYDRQKALAQGRS